MRPAALLAALTLVLGSAPSIARAQAAPAGNAAADAKIASAKQHYAKAEMGAALADLAEAYHLDPRPDLLYAMAQIEVELGDCAGAVAHYKQYLATNPSQKAKDAATKSKEACEAKLGVTPTEPVKPPPPDATIVTPPPPPPPAMVVTSRPFYKDGLGDGLAVGAVIAGGAGLGLYLVANAAASYIVNVAYGVATEVVCTFDRGAKAPLRMVGMFVHPGGAEMLKQGPTPESYDNAIAGGGASGG